VIVAGKSDMAPAETRRGWRRFLAGGPISLLISWFMGMRGLAGILKGGRDEILPDKGM